MWFTWGYTEYLLEVRTAIVLYPIQLLGCSTGDRAAIWLNVEVPSFTVTGHDPMIYRFTIHGKVLVRVCECWHWKDISPANCINLPGYTGENSTKSKGNYASAFWSQIVRIAFPIIPDVQPDTNTYTHVHLHLSTGMDIFDPCWYDHVCISGLKQPGYPMDPSSMYKLKGAIPGDDLRKSHHSDPRSQLLAQSWPDPRDLPLGVDWNCGLLMFLNMEAMRKPHHIQSPSIPFTLVIKIGMWMFIHPFIQEINEHHGFWHIPNSFYVCFDTVPVSAKHGQGILCRSGLCKNLSNHRCQPQT